RPRRWRALARARPRLSLASRIRNRPRVVHLLPGPMIRPQARQGGGELGQMQPVVGDPGDDEIEAGEGADLAERDDGAEPRGVDRLEVRKARAPACPDDVEDRARVLLSIAAGLDPGDGADGREARVPGDDGAQACAEVFRLLVPQVAEDLDGRP